MGGRHQMIFVGQHVFLLPGLSREELAMAQEFCNVLLGAIRGFKCTHAVRPAG